MDVNEVLMKYVGSFGRYQKWTCLLLGMIGFMCSFYAYDIVFAAAIPQHWCEPPKLNGTKYPNISTEELKRLTIPKEEKNGEFVYSSCLLYDDFSSVEKNGTNDERKTRKCNKWTYDQSVYTSTAVSEWDLVCDKTALVATAQSFLYAGKFVGLIMAGFLSDRFGRRPVLLVVLVLTIPIRLMMSFSVNYIMFTVACVLSGIITLFLYLVSFVLMVELVGGNWRALVGVVSAILWGVGLVVLGGIAYLLRDRFTLQIVLSIPTLCAPLYYFFMPESPRWLMSRGRREEAINLLKKMAKANNRDIPEEVIEKLRSSSSDKEGNEEKENFLDVVKYRVLIVRIIIMSFGWWSVNLGYVGLMLNTTNLSGSPFLNIAIGGLMEILGYVLAQYLMSRKFCGRRLILCFSLVLCGVSLLLPIAIPADKQLAVTCLAQIGKMLNSVAFAVLYVFAAEMFPSTVRNSGLSACATIGKTATMIAPYIVQLGTVDKVTPLVITGTMSALSGLIILLLPETRGKELHQTIGEQRRSGDSLCWWVKPETIQVPSVDGSETDVSSKLLHEMTTINGKGKPNQEHDA